MNPLCSLVLVAASLATEPPANPLEREGEKLPIVKMPLGKLPLPMNVPEPPHLKTGYLPKTEVAVEGQIQVADKDFQSSFICIKIRNQNGVIANSHVGGKPVKVKDGLYRYRSVIKMPQKPHVYYVEIYQRRDLVSRAKVDVDEDLE